MLEKIQNAITTTVEKLFDAKVEVVVSRPEEQFGDYTTNVALQLAGKLHLKPADIAEKLASQLRSDLSSVAQDVNIASNFINIRLNNAALLEAFRQSPNYHSHAQQGKQIVVEYSDPNPFKVLHAGHLYTSIIGDGIADLLEASGASVHRVNFGGDVGLHVAKTLYSILMTTTAGDRSNTAKALEAVNSLSSEDLTKRSNWLADNYVQGTADYEEDKNGAKAAAAELNKQVYGFHVDNNHDSDIAKIYWTCRQWSYDYFELFYKQIEVHPFEKYYPESETVPLALKTVNEQLDKGVYQKSDGAIVFDGEKYGLHTRVFINSAGLPTYEAKDVGLILLKWQDYHYDRSIVITGNEQVEYMRVVLKSIEQFQPTLAKATIHLTHGLVKMKGGEKMSSRKGNILRAADILEATTKANEELTGKQDTPTTLGAIKYAFLKQRIGADIIYDPLESVSLVGNSGPYLQYAHARARSILAKTGSIELSDQELESAERSLARKISEYPEVLDRAINELMSHLVCTYLYELAQIFNSFYEANRVINDPRSQVRLQLVQAYADTLKNGLAVLNISSPDRI
jgi:arginyl-tRNA synthetase